MPTDPFGRPVRGGRRPPNEVDLGPYLKPALALLLALGVAVAAARCVYTVEPNEEAVVLRFGEFRGVSQPGLHFRVPFADTVETVSIEEHTLRLPQDAPTADRPGPPPAEALMLTGELYAANVEWTIQWRVEDPAKYLFAFSEAGSPEAFSRIIGTAATTVMNQVVGDYSIDELLTSERNQITRDALEGTRALLEDRFDCGVRVTQLQLQRVTAPAEVREAFDDVVAADQDRGRYVSEGNRERARMLNEAQAARDKLVQEAQGYADREEAEVDGEIAALRLRYDAYRAAPDITRQRLYLEAMAEVLAAVDGKTILDADLRQLLPLLNLSEGGN